MLGGCGLGWNLLVLNVIVLLVFVMDVFWVVCILLLVIIFI